MQESMIRASVYDRRLFDEFIHRKPFGEEAERRFDFRQHPVQEVAMSP